MSEDLKKEEAAPVKTVTLFNRGIRIFRLPGGKHVAPGQTVVVDEALAKRLRGYRDLVDAGALSPRQKDRMAKLEGDNLALKDQVASLTAKLAEKGKPPVVPPAVPPAPPTTPEVPPAPAAGGKEKTKSGK